MELYKLLSLNAACLTTLLPHHARLYAHQVLATERAALSVQLHQMKIWYMNSQELIYI